MTIGQDKHTGLTLNGKEILLVKKNGARKQGLMDKNEQKGLVPIGPAKQLEAAALYAATGSFVLAAEKSGVEERQIRKWSKEPWFRDILHDFRIENLGKLDAAFTEIIDRAATELKDRLENGDWVLTKSGKMVRKPVGMRDLAIVQAINVDKRQLIRGEPTSRPEQSQGATVKILEDLAEKFTSIVNKKREPVLIEGEITDAEFVESPSQSHGSSSPQPSVCQEGGSSS